MADVKTVMVLVLYTHFTNPLPEAEFARLLSGIPDREKDRILKFRRWEDSHASLFGKILLQQGLTRLGIQENLNSVQYTSFNRPYINQGVDFNISHSGNYVVCAISGGTRVGIDIERISPIPITDFTRQFTPEEWRNIEASKFSLNCFYQHWTRKEAVLKANGKGLNIPLCQVNVIDANVLLDEESWTLHDITIAEGYCCTLALESQYRERICPEDVQISKVVIQRDHLTEEQT